jgi:hypothetical protein
MKKILLLILFLLSVSKVDAATINAATCSYADVSAAISSASAGDTVTVPAGSPCTWTSTLNITKGITLIGSGSGTTKIINSSNNTIDITLASDLPIRISGFYFDKVSNTNSYPYAAIHISGKTDGSFGLTQVRIDNNVFSKGTRTIFARGWVEGVIDHNTFINCNIAVGIVGDDNYSWNRPIVAGTANALFIEDNTFTINNSTDREPNQAIYQQEGGRSVTRYNIFDGSTYTNGNSLFYDSHGSWPYYDGTSNSLRGQPILEIYNNIFHGHHSYEYNNWRGGSSLIYNNTFIYDSGSAPRMIRFNEEESWQTAFFNPLRTVWPAEDQFMNNFIWNNTLNGSPITSISIESNSVPFIQKDRDYFMHAPQSSGGYSYYTGRSGASNTYPTNGSSDTSVFSSSGANAYYPYTPYTYPHPLISGGSCTPSKVVFSSQPNGDFMGVAWSSQPSVLVEDTGSNICTDATNSVTLAIGTNPGSGTLTCTTNPVNALNGVTSFVGCNIDKVGIGYTLTAAASGLTGDTSSTFNITGITGIPINISTINSRIGRTK